jgi:hypothetical protein
LPTVPRVLFAWAEPGKKGPHDASVVHVELMGSSSTIAFLIAGLLYPTLSRFENRFV